MKTDVFPIIKHIFNYIFIILLAVLCGGNNNNPDYLADEMLYYNTSEINEGAWLEYLIISIFNNLEVSFELYRLVVYFVGYYLIFKALRMYIRDTLTFSLLYMLFPMMMDATQTTNFMSMAMVFYGLCSYSKSYNEKEYIFYILLAGGYHFIAYIYLPFVFCINKDTNTLKNNIVGIICISLLFSLLLFPVLLPVLKILSIYTQNWFGGRIARYVLNEQTNLGHYYYYSLHIITIFLSNYIHKLVIKENVENNNNINGFMKLAVRFNTFLLIYFPFLHFNATAFRIWRICIILVYLMTTIVLNYKYKSSTKTKCFILTVIYAISYMYLLLINGYMENIVSTFTSNNFW